MNPIYLVVKKQKSNLDNRTETMGATTDPHKAITMLNELQESNEFPSTTYFTIVTLEDGELVGFKKIPHAEVPLNG